MSDRLIMNEVLSKVPAITLGFWIIKILATTLGETGGDTVTMTWLGETTPHSFPNGYLIGTAIFGLLLVLLVVAQIRARTFNPWLYWATIVASTTCGTLSPTSPIALSGLAIRAARCCCSPACSPRCLPGTGRLEPST